MSDSKKPLESPDDPRSEALEWLAGQFRWETLLSDLHELSERQSAEEADDNAEEDAA